MNWNPNRFLYGGAALAALVLMTACGDSPVDPEARRDRVLPASGPLVIRSLDGSRSTTGPVSGQSFAFVSGQPYALARDLLATSLGATFGSGVGEVTASALRGADVFVINPLAAELDEAEVCALEVFVNHGGALMETRNLGSRPVLLGTVPGASRGESSSTILAPGSPLVSGPFGSAAGFATGAHSAFSAWGEATPVAANTAGPNLLQLDPAAGRAGRAVFIGDEEVFIEGSFSGERSGLLPGRAANQALLLNAFTFLAAAPGAPAAAPYYACLFPVLRAALADADGLNSGLKRSVTAKIDAAEKLAAEGRGEAAANILGALGHQVDAMERAGRLSADDAEALREAIDDLIEALNG